MSAAEVSTYYDPQYRGLHVIRRKNKRGDSWHLRWNRPQGMGGNGYIHLGRFGSEERVLRARRRAQDMIDEGKTPTPADFNGGYAIVVPPRRRFEDVAEQWFAANEKHWTAKTRKVKLGYKKRVVGFFGSDNPEKIDVARVQEFYVVLEQAGMKPVSTRGLTSFLKSVLEFAEVPASPFESKKLVRPRGASDTRPIPTNASVRALSLHLTGKHLMLLGILEHTGLRPDNACSLRWGNIGPNGLVGVLNEKLTAQRKRPVYFDIPVLPYQCEDELGDWLPVRPDGVDDDDFIVGTHVRTGLPMINANQLNKAFGKAREAAAKDAPFHVEHVNPYAFRHLHQSRLHQWGAQGRHSLSAREQADRLGHSLRIADSNYTKVLPVEPAEFDAWWASKTA